VQAGALDVEAVTVPVTSHPDTVETAVEQVCVVEREFVGTGVAKQEIYV
jgi:hypothetical protein